MACCFLLRRPVTLVGAVTRQIAGGARRPISAPRALCSGLEHRGGEQQDRASQRLAWDPRVVPGAAFPQMAPPHKRACRYSNLSRCNRRAADRGHRFSPVQSSCTWHHRRRCIRRGRLRYERRGRHPRGVAIDRLLPDLRQATAGGRVILLNALRPRAQCRDRRGCHGYSRLTPLVYLLDQKVTVSF